MIIILHFYLWCCAVRRMAGDEQEYDPHRIEFRCAESLEQRGKKGETQYLTETRNMDV